MSKNSQNPINTERLKSNLIKNTASYINGSDQKPQDLTLIIDGINMAAKYSMTQDENLRNSVGEFLDYLVDENKNYELNQVAKSGSYGFFIDEDLAEKIGYHLENQGKRPAQEGESENPPKQNPVRFSSQEELAAQSLLNLSQKNGAVQRN